MTKLDIQAQEAQDKPDVNMNMNDPTETIIIDLAAAMNAAEAIRDSITEALDLYDPDGDSVDNANLCAMQLSSTAKAIDDLRGRLAKTINEYGRAKTRM